MTMMAECLDRALENGKDITKSHCNSIFVKNKSSHT